MRLFERILNFLKITEKWELLILKGKCNFSETSLVLATMVKDLYFPENNLKTSFFLFGVQFLVVV